MLRFILDMTEVPPSWLACAAECILDVLRLKLLLPGGGLTPPLGLLLGPPCADLNDEWAACEVTHVLRCHQKAALTWLYHSATTAITTAIGLMCKSDICSDLLSVQSGLQGSSHKIGRAPSE